MDRKLLALGLLPLLAGCSEKEDVPRNVLFIMVDDMKPILGCYGDSLVVTPNVDALASDGCVYANAYCQQALSGPSRASLMTGLRPETVGVTELNTWMRWKNPDVITLPQAFKEAGYCTVSVGKTFHGAKNTLDSLSWSQRPLNFSYSKSDEYQFTFNKTGEKAAASEFTSEPEEGYLDMRIRQEALHQLDSLAAVDRPFFLAVGFLKPHLPFCAPQRFWDIYESVHFGNIDTTRIEGAPLLAYHDSDELRGYTDIPTLGSFDQNQLADLKRAYYACVSYADENIGAVVSELKRLGLYDDTVIVLLGDHGYHTGEQGLWCKSTNYEAACHSPLIIKPAGKGKGSRCEFPVEFIDIFPTVAELAGIAVPEGLEGKNLLHLDPDGHYLAFSQFPRPYNALHRRSERSHMGYTVRDSRWRYVEWYDLDGSLVETELYDLGLSSLESVNLSLESDYRAVREGLAGQLRLTFDLPN